MHLKVTGMGLTGLSPWSFVADILQVFSSIRKPHTSKLQQSLGNVSFTWIFAKAPLLHHNWENKDKIVIIIKSYMIVV